MKRTSKKQNQRRKSFRQSVPATPILESLEDRRLLTINGIAVEPPVDVYTADHVVPEDTSSSEQNGSATVLRIVNGTQTNQFSSVGIVNDGCTGTLIAPNAVLTAAHCVSPGEAATFVLNGSIHTASGANVHVHPEYQSNDIDLAIIIFDTPVQGVTPSDINRTPPSVGQMLTLVGFGATGSGTTGHNGNFGVKHQGKTPLDELTQDQLIWNFDNNNEANTAPGDSGGPAYIEVNGKLYIAGITSGGEKADASIGDVSFDTRVDTHTDWIDGILGSNGNDTTPDGDVDVPLDDNPDDGLDVPVDVPVDDTPDDDLGGGGDDDFIDDDLGGGDDDLIDDDQGGGDDDFIDDDFIDDFDGGNFDAEHLALDELASYDQNNDGKLSKKELVAEFVDLGETRRDARKLAKALINEFDADNDRKLNLSELIDSYGGVVEDSGPGDLGSDDTWTDGWTWDDSFWGSSDSGFGNDSWNNWNSQDDFSFVDSYFGSYDYGF
jgi:V8-like Glu-specific endopeptidase